MSKSDYPNHETKELALQLDNDPGLNCLLEELKASSNNWIELSDNLKSYFEDLRDEVLENPTKEMVSFFFHIGSFSDINFDFLAKQYFDKK